MASVARDAQAALDGGAGSAPATTVPARSGGGQSQPLTSREIAVLRLVAQGCSNRQIAQQLHLSQHTAANHVRSILAKTGCANRTESATWALRHGIGS